VKRSTPNSEFDFDEVIEGLRVQMKRSELAKRSETFLTPEPNVSQIKPELIISVTDPEPNEVPKKEYPAAPVQGDDEADDIYNKKYDTWFKGKEAWEAEQEAKEPLKKVAVWAPVYHVVQALVDGKHLKVFHTPRGPVAGLVEHEDSNKVTLYSPALIDPNLQAGKVHYLPVAFAGYRFTIYRSSCVGESVPDQPVVLGYPKYVKANQNGDYIIRTRGAYHHIEADFATYVHPVVKDVGMRDLLSGILITSDVDQPTEIAKAKKVVDAINAVT
jgi:hypothetical protein